MFISNGTTPITIDILSQSRMNHKIVLRVSTYSICDKDKNKFAMNSNTSKKVQEKSQQKINDKTRYQ